MAEVQKSAAERLAEVELKIKEAQLEELQLAKQERELNMKDLRRRLADREVKDLQAEEDRAAQGRTFAQKKAQDDHQQKLCTHRKGGNVDGRNWKALNIGGSANQRSVIKHQMINGDMWVRCLRCGKTWSPPVPERFYFDARGKEVPPKLGKFDGVKFDKAVAEYEQAVAFETNNTTSGSVQVRFSKVEDGRIVDAAEDYRRNVMYTSLR